MRISDWSSDVCSSDLTACRGLACGGQHEPQRTAEMPVARVAQANAAAARCVQDGRVHYCGLNPMPTYKAPLRDVRFLMNEVFDYPAHYAALSNGKDADPDTVSAILAECAKFCAEIGRTSGRERVCQYL